MTVMSNVAVLDISSRATTAGTTLCVTGDLDVATIAELRNAARESLRRGDDVVIDLAGITFFDAGGIGALIAIVGEVAPGQRVTVARPSATVSRLLSIVGLADAGWLAA